MRRIVLALVSPTLTPTLTLTIAPHPALSLILSGTCALTLAFAFYLDGALRRVSRVGCGSNGAALCKRRGLIRRDSLRSSFRLSALVGGVLTR
eukprot:6206654-Pleurochrysis_carterae.AAC.2